MVMASKTERIEIQQGLTVRVARLRVLGSANGFGTPPGHPPACEHLYARVMERTVFGRPKALMFMGGFGSRPGKVGAWVASNGTHPVPLSPCSHPMLRTPAGSGIPERAGHGPKGYGH